MNDEQLWNVFRETGDPLGYLLYRAGRERQQTAPRSAGRETRNAPGKTRREGPEGQTPRPEL